VAEDLAKLALKEIQLRYLCDPSGIDPQVAAALEADPRAGARTLLRAHRRRLERTARTRARRRQLLEIEGRLWGAGVGRVAGVDEVGIGPLAGPVVAAAVIFDPAIDIDGIDDSKAIAPARRERLAEAIAERALAVAVAEVDERKIDRLNIHHAALEAMRLAVERLAPRPEHILVDARRIPGIEIPQQPIVGGDRLSYSVAAASIVAKVHRDALMVRYDPHYPQYGFASHKGYGTADHVRAIRAFGPSPIHRLSYGVISRLAPGRYGPRYFRVRAELAHALDRRALAEWRERTREARRRLNPFERARVRDTAVDQWRRFGPADPDRGEPARQ
jgi:ribonuclease HII